MTKIWLYSGFCENSISAVVSIRMSDVRALELSKAINKTWPKNQTTCQYLDQ